METTYKLYNGITSYVHYLSNMLGDEQADSKKIIKKDNIKFAKLAIIQNFFLLEKKEVLAGKGNNAFYSKLIDKYLEELIRLLLPKASDDLCYIGGEKVKIERAVAILRNKFTNGEFYIDSIHDAIVLETKPKETIMSIKTLESLFISVANALTNVQRVNHVDRIIIQSNIKDSKAIKNEDELRDLLNNIVMRRYSLKSIKEEKIDEDVINEFYQFVVVVNQYLKLGDSFDDIFKSYQKALSKKGIKLEETISKFSLNEISLIIDTISVFEQDFYKVCDYDIQKNKINEFMIAIKNPEYNGSSFLIENARNLIRINNIDELDKVSINEYLAAIISEFLVLYNPLFRDNIKEFDFASLDLYGFKPMSVSFGASIIERKKQEYLYYTHGKNASIEELNKYKEEYIEPEADKEFLMTKMKLKLREIQELNDILEVVGSELNDLCNANPKGIDNRILINGLKNAIVYGDVSIRKSLLPSTSIRDYVINFKYNSVDQPFELNVTLEKFLTLFNEYNVNAIDKYFNSLEKAKKKVRK